MQVDVSRRALLVALARAALAPSSAALAAPPDDLPGWRQARWGMTAAELEAAFRGEIKPAERGLDYNRLVVRQTIPRATVAGRPFIVLFQLDRKSGRLAQILLQFRGRRPTHTDSVAVLQALEAELGRPLDGRHESDYSGSFPSFSVEWLWRFKTTSVRLRYTDPNADPNSRPRKELLIRWFPTAAKALS